jgi:hypothetical protein
MDGTAATIEGYFVSREFCDRRTQTNTVCYFDTGPTFHRHRWTHLSFTQVVKIANHVWRESYNHNFFSFSTGFIPNGNDKYYRKINIDNIEIRIYSVRELIYSS